MIKALLTIDDIASQNTKAIVDYLVEKNISAIMFAVGMNVERYYDQAIYAVQKGMIVGNHSYSHPNFGDISYEEGVAEIEKNEKLLDELYKTAGVERKYKPFRFPYGNKGGENKERFQKYLRDNGFDKVDDRQVIESWWHWKGMDCDIDTFWTFDFAEYNIRKGSGFTIEDVWKRMREDSEESESILFKEGSNHILLLHANDETEELAPEYYRKFLDYTIKKGVVFEDACFLRD